MRISFKGNTVQMALPFIKPCLCSLPQKNSLLKKNKAE